MTIRKVNPNLSCHEYYAECTGLHEALDLALEWAQKDGWTCPRIVCAQEVQLNSTENGVEVATYLPRRAVVGTSGRASTLL